MPITTAVRDIMTTDLVSVKTTDQVIVAIEVMTKNNIGSALSPRMENPWGY